MEKVYKSQVKLLLDVLPLVAKEKCFALHGGTAINLFVRNMPRLSVDIDLTYLQIEDWDTSIGEINNALSRIKSDIEKSMNASAVLKAEVSKLLISTKQASIKLEVSRMGRGAYEEPEVRVLCERAQEEYNTFCEIAVVSLGQLYGGKICAALDRQHPRDIFDVKYLLANEGFNDEIKKGFLFCLLGAKRPLFEMLNPNFIDQKSALEKQFNGMTSEALSYEEYEQIKVRLVETVTNGLDKIDREFLLEFKNMTPNWEKYAYSHFPSIKWKMKHLQELMEKNPSKHKDMLNELKKALKLS